jgi:ATP-binding cassette subfamily A (ABC1) protein 1
MGAAGRLGRLSEDDINLDGHEEEVDMEDYEQAQLRNEQAVLNSLQTEQDKRINEFIKQRIPNSILVENIGTEITYSISNKLEHTKNYERVFAQLEANRNRLGIDSIGLSDTTLEEIFIKLAKQPKTNAFKGRERTLCGFNVTKLRDKLFCLGGCCRGQAATPKTLTAEQATKYASYTSSRVSYKSLLIQQQLYALLVKRFHRVKRNIKGFFAEIVLPVVFVCLALAVATLNPTASNRPALELHPWYYQAPNQMFFSKSTAPKYDLTFYGSGGGGGLRRQPEDVVDPSQQANIQEVEQIFSSFVNNPGPGTRCMKGHTIVIPQQRQDYTRANGPQVLDCAPDNVYAPASMPPATVVAELAATNFTYSKVSVDCDCSSGFPECPDSAGGDFNYRDIYTLRTRDILYNLTSRNMTDWLVKTELSKQFFKKRYGGYEFTPPFIYVNNQYAANFLQNLGNFSLVLRDFLNLVLPPDSAANARTTTTNQSDLNATTTAGSGQSSYIPGSDPLISSENLRIWYSTKGYDSSVSYLNVINNAILRTKIRQLNALNANSSEPMLDPTEHGIVAL